MPVKIDSRHTTIFLFDDIALKNIFVFEYLLNLFFNPLNGCFLYMKLIARIRLSIMGNIWVIFIKWVVFQLVVFPFLLLSFVPTIYVFPDDVQRNLLNPFHIRKSVTIQLIYITIMH